MKILQLMMTLETAGVAGPFRAGNKLIAFFSYERVGPLPLKTRLLLKKHKQLLLRHVLTTAQAGISPALVEAILKNKEGVL